MSADIPGWASIVVHGDYVHTSTAEEIRYSRYAHRPVRRAAFLRALAPGVPIEAAIAASKEASRLRKAARRREVGKARKFDRRNRVPLGMVIRGNWLGGQSPLQRILSIAATDPNGPKRGRGITGAVCICNVPTAYLESAFVHLERRILHLQNFRPNHHGRQLAAWLGKWLAWIDQELSRRPKRRSLYTEIV